MEKATVSFVHKDNSYLGQGILVAPGLIFTAAHCLIQCRGKERLHLKDCFIENIQVNNNNLVLALLFLEPMRDFAVLEEIEVDDAFVEEKINFMEFCENVIPIQLCNEIHKIGQEFNIHIYSHEMKWIHGTATLTWINDPALLIKTNKEQIVSGTSGGAIINDRGELISIVSSTVDVEKINDQYMSSHCYLPLAFPLWLHNRLK